LVNKLEERALLEQLVTECVLNCGEYCKKLLLLYFAVPQQVTEAVSESRLEAQQWLDGHLVDLLEAFAIDTREILNFKFLNQLLVGVGEEGLPENPI
jgi:hypothetical protein